MATAYEQTLSQQLDLADVQDLIRTLDLPADYADQLSPYVREKFREMHQSVQAADK